VDTTVNSIVKELIILLIKASIYTWLGFYTSAKKVMLIFQEIAPEKELISLWSWISLPSLVSSRLKRAHGIGLFVTSVTIDMSSANRAMWSSFEISCSRLALTRCLIPHPMT